MILALVLAIGALGLAIAEIVRLFAGQIGVLDGTIEVLVWWTMAAGIWGLRHKVGFDRPGRIGIVLMSFAAMSFGMVMLIVLTSGTLGALVSGEIVYSDIVFTPFYLLALVFLVGALAAFARYFWVGGENGFRLLALGFALLAAVHGARLFLPGTLTLHGLANIALAAALLGLVAIAITDKSLKAR